MKFFTDLKTVAFSGSYNDLSNKPTIPAAQIQSNWTQTTTTALDYIKNKPTLGTASAKDVPSSGNASTSQVVMGNDTRLSDSRNAKDVYSWAKASTKPSYTASEVGLGNVGNFKAVSTVASQGLSDAEKSNARANIGAGTSSFSGNYNDLSNKPTIPTVNNATLTIQKNGTNVQTFTANQSSNVTANITVPTKTSELTNDSGYSSSTIKSATLAAGATTVTFTGLPATGNYIVDFFTSNGANYTGINTSTSGQVTLTFDAQSTAITVYCEIKEI